jgi:hypothetical protein
MRPELRKLTLTLHVSSSVGWLGAVVAMLALGSIGAVSHDDQQVRAVFLVMSPTARYALVPLAVLSLLTGLVQSLGTRWGLFQHYWVVFKLVMNLAALVVLLAYLQTLDELARLAATPSTGEAEFGAMRASPAVHSLLALALLVVATVLAIYKPHGLTRHGRRVRTRQKQPGPARNPHST